MSSIKLSKQQQQVAKLDDRCYSVSNYSSDSDGEENRKLIENVNTSKRKVNHKTRRIETRVQRQLVLEGGKVIADSGPQVVTKISEDNRVEECEKERAPRGVGGRLALPSSTSVGKNILGEKRQIQRVSREVREENMQYHDESVSELKGRSNRVKAARNPNELLSLRSAEQMSSESEKEDDDRDEDGNRRHKSKKNKEHRKPRGKLIHYSNKGRKFADTDEITEYSKLGDDGAIVKEVKHVRHHEEFSDDELPDENNEAEALRDKPSAERSVRRHYDYVQDFDDFATPPHSDNDEYYVQRDEHNALRSAQSNASIARKQHTHNGRQSAASRHSSHKSNAKIERIDSQRSAVSDARLRHSQQNVNKKQLIATNAEQQQQQQHYKTKASKSKTLPNKTNSDACVQASLSDEELRLASPISRTSSRHRPHKSSSLSKNHEYNERHRQRKLSEASSLDSVEFETAKQRVSSNKSPEPIYAQSTKQRSKNVTSPTLSTGSQRRVKTTTTTMSAGIEDIDDEDNSKGRAKRAATTSPTVTTSTVNNKDKVSRKKTASPLQRLGKLFRTPAAKFDDRKR